MKGTRTLLLERPERGDGPRDAPMSVGWGWAPSGAPRPGPPEAAGGDPDEPGISLCERERRWACEWWPPD
jgi:hypothetical protein